MKRILALGSVVILFGAAYLVNLPATPIPPGEAAAVKLFKSLTAEQKKKALLAYDAKEKYKEAFPAVTRPGLPFTELTEEQKQLVNEAISAVTSEYGAERILKLAKQTNASKRYLNFFGDPTKDKQFAWRMAQHHLTLIHAEFGKGKANEFGPILLGGNPAKTLWDEEDDLFRKLYASLSDEEKTTVGKNAKGKKGIVIGNLSPKAKMLAHELLKKRAAVFADNYRQVLENQIKNNGGIDGLQLWVKGKDMSKSHHQGGRYDWAISGKTFLCNWQTRGNEHIHMTLRAKS